MPFGGQEASGVCSFASDPRADGTPTIHAGISLSIGALRLLGAQLLSVRPALVRFYAPFGDADGAIRPLRWNSSRPEALAPAPQHSPSISQAKEKPRSEDRGSTFSVLIVGSEAEVHTCEERTSGVVDRREGVAVTERRTRRGRNRRLFVEDVQDTTAERYSVVEVCKERQVNIVHRRQIFVDLGVGRHGFVLGARERSRGGMQPLHRHRTGFPKSAGHGDDTSGSPEQHNRC